MLKEIQREVDKWIAEVGKRYFSELTNMALLTEEVGELARVIARVYGDQRAKPGDLKGEINAGSKSNELDPAVKQQLAEEMADVIWVVTCLANQTGVDLSEAFEASLRKKYTRDRHRFE